MSAKEIFLVTEARGLVGSNLVRILAKHAPDSRIIAVHRSREKQSWNEDTQVQSVYGDLRDSDVWKTLPSTITCVFHLAAVMPFAITDKQRAAVVRDNLLPIANLIECSQNWPDLKQVIFSSSVSIYDPTEELVTENSFRKPTDLYGASKLAGEDLLLCLESRGTLVARLRYSSVYGFGQRPGSVLPAMLNGAVERGEIHVYGSGTRTQDFVYCGDAANANLLAYLKQASGAFNIGSGIAVSMAELAETISQIFTNKTTEIVYRRDQPEGRSGLLLDLSKAKEQLSYRPLVPLRLGLEKLKTVLENETP